MKKVGLALVVLFLTGSGIRVLTLHDTGAAGDPIYGVESAQHFWYVRQAAAGLSIPDAAQQRLLEWPAGAPGDEDTYLSWQLIGGAAQVLAGLGGLTNDDGLLLLCRGTVIAATAIPPLLLFLFLRPVCGPRPALLLALIVAVSLPLVERSFGSLLYHEHLVLVFIIGHALASYRHWLGQARHPLRTTLLAGVLLALALHGWKATRFYYLIHLGILTWFLLLAPGLARVLPRIRQYLLATLPVLLAAGLLSPHLCTDGFWHSPTLIYHCLLALFLIGAKRTTLPLRRGMALIVGAAVAGTVGLTLLAGLLFPATGSYGHVWGVFFAQLQHGFVKPADPALLTPEARLYWVAPYQHASSLRFANDLGLLTLFALAAVVVAVRRWRRGDDVALLALLGALATGSAYFLFFKTVTMFVPHLLFLLAAAAPAVANRRALLLGLLLLAGGETYKTIAREQSVSVRVLTALGATEDQQSPTGSILDRNELLAYLRNTSDPDAVIAHYGIGAPILAYIGKPIVLQCYFETARVRDKIFSFANALYGSEAGFTAWADRHNARLLVYSADLALATDGGSYRYLANAINEDSTFADSCHFTPELLHDWRLLWQNRFYRVFQLRRAGDSSPPLPATGLTGTPAVFAAAAYRRYRANGRTGDEFLRDAMAYDRARAAAELLAREPATREPAEAIRRQAAQRFPQFSD